jgi:hypothetical protein
MTDTRSMKDQSKFDSEKAARQTSYQSDLDTARAASSATQDSEDRKSFAGSHGYQDLPPTDTHDPYGAPVSKPKGRDAYGSTV